MIVVVDNGSGADEITRLVRCSVASPKKIPAASGYILSDGSKTNAALNKKLIKSSSVPILAIGNAYTFLVESFGGRSKKVPKEEGQEKLKLDHPCPIFLDMKRNFTVFKSCDFAFDDVPENFMPVASSKKCPFEAVADGEQPFFGLRFLPEKGGDGVKILKNFANFVDVWGKYHK